MSCKLHKLDWKPGLQNSQMTQITDVCLSTRNDEQILCCIFTKSLGNVEGVQKATQPSHTACILIWYFECFRDALYEA